MYLKYKYCLFSITKLNKFNTFLDLGENSRTLLAILVIPPDPLLFRDRGPFASAHDLSLLRFYAPDAFILVLFSYAPLDFPSYTIVYDLYHHYDQWHRTIKQPPIEQLLHKITIYLDLSI